VEALFWSRIFFIVWQSDADHYRNSNSQVDIKKSQSNKIQNFPKIKSSEVYGLFIATVRRFIWSLFNPPRRTEAFSLKSTYYQFTKPMTRVACCVPLRPRDPLNRNYFRYTVARSWNREIFSVVTPQTLLPPGYYKPYLRFGTGWKTMRKADCIRAADVCRIASNLKVWEANNLTSYLCPHGRPNSPLTLKVLIQLVLFTCWTEAKVKTNPSHQIAMVLDASASTQILKGKLL